MPIFDETGVESYTSIEHGLFRALYLADQCDHVQWIDYKDVREDRSPECDECAVDRNDKSERTWRKVYVKA